MQGLCPAGRRTTLAQTLPASQPGWLLGQARLLDGDDVLAADNTCGLVVQVAARPRYALVTRQTAGQRPSSSHYLECALLPDGPQSDDASAELWRIDPADFDRERLGQADLVVIDHPGPIESDDLEWLAELLRRGRPMIYVCSEASDAVNLRD